ncbi:MAG: hypothetical protein KF914_02325 [Rhizobiaceae bacterium]|nr:hypothetical protein [Rhizobiaceae bacterium]
MLIETRSLTRAALLLAAGGFLSACVSSGPAEGPGSTPPKSAAASGVEGEWLSSDGIAVSRLSGGVFTTNALDTGNKLADGSYRVNGSVVEITVVSLIRNTTTNVNCALVSPNQLNCTSSTGQQFILNRRNAAAA